MSTKVPSAGQKAAEKDATPSSASRDDAEMDATTTKVHSAGQKDVTPRSASREDADKNARSLRRRSAAKKEDDTYLYYTHKRSAGRKGAENDITSQKRRSAAWLEAQQHSSTRKMAVNSAERPKQETVKGVDKVFISKNYISSQTEDSESSVECHTSSVLSCRFCHKVVDSYDLHTHTITCSALIRHDLTVPSDAALESDATHDVTVPSDEAMESDAPQEKEAAPKKSEATKGQHGQNNDHAQHGDSRETMRKDKDGSEREGGTDANDSTDTILYDAGVGDITGPSGKSQDDEGLVVVEFRCQYCREFFGREDKFIKHSKKCHAKH
jgi:hypothetical protein